MRLNITLKAHKPPLNLPFHNNHLLQGVIYENLDRKLADWLHNSAYKTTSHSYKMFVYSRLLGKYEIYIHPENKKKSFRYLDKANFEFRSVNNDVICSFAENLLSQGVITINKQPCDVRVEIIPDPKVNFSKPIKIKALSAITLHTTHGKNKVEYYHPFDSRWSNEVIANLNNKAKALSWEDEGKMLQGTQIIPINIQSKDKAVVRYKDYWLEAWRGLYEANIPEPYFWLAYKAGLGARNSQGFGMIGVIK